MFLIIAAVAVLAGAGAVVGQTVSWTGPISGVIYDSPSRSVRPVIGFPGSSYLGQAILTDIESGSIAPDGESAVAVEAGRPVLITSLRSGNRSRLYLPESVDRLDRVAWASDSRVAAVYSSSGRRLVRIEISDSSLAAVEAVDLSDLRGEIVSLVTNGDGSRIVIGVRDPDDGGIYLLRANSIDRLASMPNPGPAVFTRTGNILYAVDQDAPAILRFLDVDSGNYERLSFAGEENPMVEPRGIAASRDGRTLYLASASDRVVRVFDLSSRALRSEIPLNVVPNTLTELPGTSSVFVITSRDAADQPIWILDARLAPSVYFVPAGE